MLSNKISARIKPYIQPFERDLALRELRHLSKTEIEGSMTDAGVEYFFIEPTVDAEYLADRVTYWESIGSPVQTWTKQIRREATTNLVRNGGNPSDLLDRLPFDADNILIPNRRCLRYGPHDLHDYRGKFFPQLVRSLLNIADLPEAPLVLDPMCGSGTTLVEANLLGYEGMGFDLNPLSVLIANTKCAILHDDPISIIAKYETLTDALRRHVETPASPTVHYLKTLPDVDQAYLESWFDPGVLADLNVIASLIYLMDRSATQDLFWLCLSDILRPVSLQRTEDLRIRRDNRHDRTIDAISEFLAQFSKTVRNIVAFLLEDTDTSYNSTKVFHKDARLLNDFMGTKQRLADVVITSPPYATALPYLDTDRLSLCFLGLMPRTQFRATDSQMIGNREITGKQRDILWQDFHDGEPMLPSPVRDLIKMVDQVYRDQDVGFRRKNLSALLAKYFLDMRRVFDGLRGSVNAGGQVFVVIGDNHTVANGNRIEINTASLLGEIGKSIGLEFVETIPMEMLRPRDIFKKNAVASEHILHFRVDA